MVTTLFVPTTTGAGEALCQFAPFKSVLNSRLNPEGLVGHSRRTALGRTRSIVSRGLANAQGENSEVLPLGSVAVAVKVPYSPGFGKVAVKVASQFVVVTFVAPRKTFPGQNRWYHTRVAAPKVLPPMRVLSHVLRTRP